MQRKPQLMGPFAASRAAASEQLGRAAAAPPDGLPAFQQRVLGGRQGGVYDALPHPPNLHQRQQGGGGGGVTQKGPCPPEASALLLAAPGRSPRGGAGWR
jgi:hypothetical protein